MVSSRIIPGLVNSSFDFISNSDNRGVTRGSRYLQVELHLNEL